MREVAQAAGVSIMTVSRVLNGERHADDIKRRDVMNAIQRLGYVPNPAARTLAGTRAWRVAVPCSEQTAPLLGEFLIGALGEARENGVLVYAERFDVRDLAETLGLFICSEAIDGVLLPPPFSDDISLIETLRAMRMPIVRVGAGDPVDFADSVIVDDDAAAFVATSHLIALGHRRIGFIGGQPRDGASVRRRRGYERALRKAGIEVQENLQAQGDFTYRGGLLAAEDLLGRQLRPTAIFACNDEMAAATIASAQRYRIDVPADLSVIGFDDTPLAAMIWPPLSTIRQPVQEMARLGTRLLIASIRAHAEGKSPRRRHLSLGLDLIVRGTDAKARSELVLIAPPSEAVALWA